MHLHLSTWQEIDAWLEQSRAVLVPIGSTEQHGPNGFLGTDALCPEIIAGAAAEKTDMLIAPTFSVGSAQHHLGFSGTITLRPSTMIAAMQDWTASLVRHGFEKIYWFNGHGGNIPAINAAFAEIYAERSFVRGGRNDVSLLQKMQNWWELPGVADVIAGIYPKGDGSHATASEVAVTYSAYPDFVKNVEMSPKLAPEGEIHDAEHYRRSFPDGRIGSDPSQATPEDGKRIVEAAATALANEFKAFTEGE